MHVPMKHLVWAAAVVCGLQVSTASAQQVAGNPCLYGFNGGYGLYYNIYGYETVPYFALHPPVYYSYPVARPYGYSPWAYPPGTMTPDVESVQPKEMINPHVEPAPAQPTNDNSARRADDAPVPLVILNPFVDQAQDAAAQSGIIRPAKLVIH